jgi:hypothetical protein
MPTRRGTPRAGGSAHVAKAGRFVVARLGSSRARTSLEAEAATLPARTTPDVRLAAPRRGTPRASCSAHEAEAGRFVVASGQRARTHKAEVATLPVRTRAGARLAVAADSTRRMA